MVTHRRLTAKAIHKVLLKQQCKIIANKDSKILKWVLKKDTMKDTMLKAAVHVKVTAMDMLHKDKVTMMDMLVETTKAAVKMDAAKDKLLKIVHVLIKQQAIAGACIAIMILATITIGNVATTSNIAKRNAAVMFQNIMKYKSANMFHNTIVKHAAVMNQNTIAQQNAFLAKNGFANVNADMFQDTTTNTYAKIHAALHLAQLDNNYSIATNGRKGPCASFVFFFAY